jgi:acyl-CoA dehydrogenase
LVAASFDGEVAVFLVESGTPGVSVNPQETASGDPYGYVTLEGAEVPAAALLGGDVGWGIKAASFIQARMIVGLCAVQLGVTSRALELTAEYAAHRVQFNRPIGTFQAVGHRAADAYIDVEGIRLTLWQAVYLLEQEEDASVGVAVAKWWAAEGGHRVAHAAVHLHGGMGVASEYIIHRYFSHAKQIEFCLGGAGEQALRIGALYASEGV